VAWESCCGKVLILQFEIGSTLSIGEFENIYDVAIGPDEKIYSTFENWNGEYETAIEIYDLSTKKTHMVSTTIQR
jgi:hypothetical protein